MLINMEQTIVEGVKILTHEQQLKVVNFIKELLKINKQGGAVWDKIDRRIAQVSPEIWDRLPTDGAEQHDHYLYGSPKR